MTKGKALLVDTRRQCYIVRLWDERELAASEELTVPWTSQYGLAETTALTLLNTRGRRRIPERTVPPELLRRDEVQVLIKDAEESEVSAA